MHLALFDLDNILVDGDCSELWNAWMLRHGWLGDDQALPAWGLTQRRVCRLRHEESLALVLAPLEGRRVGAVHDEARTFLIDQVVPRLYPQARDQVALHQARGDVPVLVSASSRHLVEPLAEYLEVAHVIAVEPEVHEGCFTGATHGVLSYRGGKVQRLQAWLDEQGVRPRRTTCYSASRNDLPLLAQVDEPVAVNPDPVLAEVARFEGWRRLDWRAPCRQDRGVMPRVASA